jgi:hypothetical protein
MIDKNPQLRPDFKLLAKEFNIPNLLKPVNLDNLMIDLKENQIKKLETVS